MRHPMHVEEAKARVQLLLLESERMVMYTLGEEFPLFVFEFPAPEDSGRYLPPSPDVLSSTCATLTYDNTLPDF